MYILNLNRLKMEQRGNISELKRGKRRKIYLQAAEMVKKIVWLKMKEER